MDTVWINIEIGYIMTQWYKTIDVNILLKWLLLIADLNYTVKRLDGRIWLYDNNNKVVEYIDDSIDNK